MRLKYFFFEMVFGRLEIKKQDRIRLNDITYLVIYFERISVVCVDSKVTEVFLDKSCGDLGNMFIYYIG